jgi:TonB-linked SusC/RagA family outer membrane protein
VVVTALGVTREQRDLGYSAQSVSGAQLVAVPQTNVVSALSGNVAGVHVTSSSVPGGTARIVIRGSKSISGSNQPLFIVDGLPIDNSSRDNVTGLDYGNRAADVDPNNIESITVLKGPNAAAVYGSRAANGAVVITTKSGRSSQGKGITATVGVTFDTPLRLPDYHNEYGQGFGGEFSYLDGRGNGLFDNADESWGPKLDGRLIDQFTGKQQPWVAHPNNVRDFFELGRSSFVNASFSRAGERSNLRLSVSRNDMNGMAPGNTLATTSMALKGGVELTERLSANASINYINRLGDNRPGIGYDGDNFMQQFVWFGRQVDIKALKSQVVNPDGSQYSWNMAYHDNPYWIQNVNKNWDSRNRVIGSMDLVYQATDWMTAMVRVGQDYRNDFTKRTFAAGTHGVSFAQGGFNEGTGTRTEQNTEFVLTAMRQLNPDLTMTATFGGNRRVNEINLSNVSVGALKVPGIYSLNNAGQTPNNTFTYNKKQVNSLRGTLTTNYKGFWSVDMTANNDWSSTLPKENASYFYPSISSAFVFSDAFGLESNFFSSGKIRASWAQVGNDTDPYQLATTIASATPFNTIPAYRVRTTLSNPHLKPEETNSVEFGTDLGFFNERLGLVATYYDSKTRNQILNVQTSGASGYPNRLINAGEVRSWGVELQLNTTPLQLDNGFRWDMTVNFDKNNNEVTELYGEMLAQNLGNSYWSMDIQARKGRPYGVLFGNGFWRDDDGNLFVDADGIPMHDPDKRVLGNYNPKWSAGLSNRFSYKNLDFSFLVDGKYGGEIFSTTIWFGQYAGVLKETRRGREVDFEEPGLKITGIYGPGVEVDGVDVSGKPVTTEGILAEDYYGSLFGNHEAGIVDASFLKLREVRLGYRVPQSLLNRLGFSSMNVAVVGKNLLLRSKAPHIDPETAFNATNVQGIEFGQFPTARSIGFTVSVQP